MKELQSGRSWAPTSNFKLRTCTWVLQSSAADGDCVFCIFLKKTSKNWKPSIAALQNLRFSLRKRGEIGNSEILGAPWWTCATWRCSLGPPGVHLVSFRGPPEGLPELPGASEYVVFQTLSIYFRFWARLATRPLQKRIMGRIAFGPMICRHLNIGRKERPLL